MQTDTLLKILPLAISLVSLIISLLSYLNNEKTRRLSVLNFKNLLKESYYKWRDQLGTIELDPPPGENNRVYTEIERRKIRDYWPRVALGELRMFKRVDKKLLKQDRADWEIYLKEGIEHRSILQEFCYYEIYEDIGNNDKKELVKIVKDIYFKAHKKDLNIELFLDERKNTTQ